MATIAPKVYSHGKNLMSMLSRYATHAHTHSQAIELFWNASESLFDLAVWIKFY